MSNCNCMSDECKWELYPDGQWTCTNCGQVTTIQCVEVHEYPPPGERGGEMAIQQERA